MRTWTANTLTDARPEQVLGILTDPDEIARWAPISFEVDELDYPRLVAGSRARVSGPVAMDVRYDLRPVRRGAMRSEMAASVSVHAGGGLAGRLLAEATNGLLKAGAINTAVARIAREAALV
jgi:hypothetical protein